MNENFQNVKFERVEFNGTDILIASSEDVTAISNTEYEQFLADIWVGIVLTLMVLSCVCFMCSCLIYHKFQQWKSRVIQARNAANIEAGLPDVDLPSYTIASGLPSYEEALEQLKKVKQSNQSGKAKGSDSEVWIPHTPPVNPPPLVALFQYYRGNGVELKT